MRKVELRMNEEYKYKIIKKLVETNGNKQRAAIKLKRSVRQIDRMIAGYKEHGKEFLETRENINLSIDEVRVILRDRYIFSPRTHKSTKRKFRKKLENEIKTAKKKEQEKLKNKLVLTEDAHPRQPRCQYFGEELQMDITK